MERFVGRTEEQGRFRRLLGEVRGDRQDDEPDEGYVMLVHGPGGIGKSSLLHRLYDIATGRLPSDSHNRRRFLVARVDWETDQQLHGDHYRRFAGPPIWRILEQIRASIDSALIDEIDEPRRRTGRNDRSIRDWLRLPADSSRALTRKRRTGRAARAFADFYQRVLQVPELDEQARRLGVQPEPGSRGLKAERAASLVDAAVTGAAQVAGIPMPPGQPVQSLTKAVGGAVSGARRHSRGGIDAQAYRALVDDTGALVDAFADGLRTLSRRRPILLILDTCEMLGSAHGWLREAMRRSGREVLWVVGMRLESESDAVADSESALYQRNLDERRLRTVAVARFDDRTVARYLDEHGEVQLDGPAVDRVAKATRGVPLNVATVCELLSRGVPLDDAVVPVTPNGEVSDTVRIHAQRYLVHTRKIVELRDDLPKLFGMSLLRGRDPDLLAALWDVELEEVAPELDLLASRHDFVHSASRSLHHGFRDTIQLFLLDRHNRAGTRKMNDRAVGHLRERLEAARHTTVDAQLGDQQWRSNVDALLWHMCWIDPADGVALLSHLFPAAASLVPDWATKLLDTVRFFAPICHPADLAMFQALDGVVRSQPTGRLSPQEMAAFNTLSAKPPAAPVLATEPAAGTYLNLLRAQYSARLGLSSAQQVTALRKATTEVPAEDTMTARALCLAVIRLVDVADDLHTLPKNLKGALHAAARYVVKHDGTDRDAWFALGRALNVVGKSTDAERAYRKVIDLHAAHPEAHYNVGDELIRQYRYQEAEVMFRRSIELGLDDADAHIRLGEALVALNRHAEAIGTFHKAAGLRPTGTELARAYGGVGNALFALGRPAEAERACREAIRIDADNARAYEGLGLALDALGRLEEAESAYRQAIQIDPSAGLHSNLGTTLQDLGRYDEAELTLREAVRLDPTDAAAHGNLGNLLTEIGRTAEAEQSYRAALRLHPANDLARASNLSNLAELYLATGQLAEARQTLAQAARIAERSAETDTLLWAINRVSDPRAARNHLLTARDRLEEVRPPATARGWIVRSQFKRAELQAIILTGLGDPERARAVLSAAVSARLPDDRFYRPLYELLGGPDPVPGLSQLLDVWREIITADPGAAGQWGGPAEP